MLLRRQDQALGGGTQRTAEGRREARKLASQPLELAGRRRESLELLQITVDFLGFLTFY